MEKTRYVNEIDFEQLCDNPLFQNDDLRDNINEAIELENAEKVTDLKEFAKTTRSSNMNPDKFVCILSKTTLR